MRTHRIDKIGLRSVMKVFSTRIISTVDMPKYSLLYYVEEMYKHQRRP